MSALKKEIETTKPMKTDNQHLDFLISQYVDGSLDPNGKKTVEQQLLNDPAARKLYVEHQEVQDILDDWGDRIPMIDWDGFEKKLDKRLEREVIEKERVSIFRRRMRPVAAAAALLIAAGIGYGWHAMSHTAANSTNGPQMVSTEPAGKGMSVRFPDMAGMNQASQQSLRVELPAAALANSGVSVAIGAPDDAAAVKSLMDSLVLGPVNLEQAALQQQIQSRSSNGSVSSSLAVTDPNADRQDAITEHRR